MMTNLLFNQATAIGKRLAMVLTMLLIVGIGQVWGETYERLTSIANIDESAQYVLGVDGTGFHYSGTSSWGKTASPANQTPYKYTLKKAADGKSFTAKTTINSTTYYLQIPTSNTFSMATSTGTNTDIIIGTTTNCTDKAYAVANKSTTARHLRINGSSGLRSYAGTTGTIAFFYKVVTATKTLSSISVNGQTTSYNVGDDFSFDGTCTAKYSDNSTKNVTPTSVSSPDMSNAGEKTITVSYTEGGITRTTNYIITVTEASSGGDEACNKWVEVDLSDIQSTDDVVIAMEKAGTIWALPNNGGTSTPSAVVITSTNLASKNGIADNLTWNISNSSGTLTIYPTGDTSKWLYCTDSNTGVRVGNTNANKTFTIDANSGYLKHDGTSRYVGVYTTNPDWRCYENTTGNIAGQTLKFYKYVACGSTQPTYFVTIADNIENGEVTANLTSATAGTEIELTATPTNGYQFSSWIVTKDGGGTVEVTNNKFTMPASNVTVSATFEALPKLTTPTNLSVSDISCSNATLAWSAVVGASKYELRLTNTSTSNTTTSYPTTNSAYLTLAAGTTYSWTVQAIGDGITYNNSDITEGEDFTSHYTITYNVDGGTTVEDGCGTTLPAELPAPTKTGYTFAGWYTNSELTIAATAGAAITQNTTLYAKWTAKTYIITLDANGGTFVDKRDSQTKGSATFDYIYGTYATYNDAPNLTEYYSDLKRDGYQFDKWVSGGSPWNKLFTSTGDRTIQAQWSKLHTVTFNTGTNNPTVDAMEGTSETGITLPAGPTPACSTDGWEFAGWWTGSVAGTTTSPGELLTADSNYKPTTNCTLYAVYSHTEAGGGGGSQTVTLTNDEIDAAYVGSGDNPTTSYGNHTIVSASGTWGGLITIGNQSGEKYVGISAHNDNRHLASPIFSANITNITIIGRHNASKTRNIYICSSNTTEKPTSGDIGSGSIASSGVSNQYTNWTDVSIPVLGDYKNFYVYADGGLQIYSIVVTTSGGSTTTYNSNPTCLDPVWNGATIDKTSFTVNCGERSPMTGANGAAKITFSAEKIYNFTKDIKIEATTGFLVSTNQTEDANYKSSVYLSPRAGNPNANTFHEKPIYVRAEAPAQSDTDLEGTITIKNSTGETLQTFSVTADVTCTQYTLTLVDRSVSTEQPTKYYAGETIDEVPADPEGVCTDPIHYVFDGWAAATVSEGSTEYTKVTFPYTVTGNTKFYAVYRYVEDGGADSGDYVKVTENLDDYSGDYLIVYEAGSLALNGALVGDGLDASGNSISVTITDNTIVATDEVNASNFTIAKEDDGYSIRSASGYYIGQTTNANDLKTNSTEYYANTITLSNDDNADVVSSGAYLRYNAATGNTNLRFRYYKSDNYTSQKAIALYRKAASYLYTTSPVCGPHLAITEGKEIYVTGGNAGAARDLVMASQKVSYQATRLKTQDGSPEGTAPDVKVANNGITKGGVVTTEVKVTFENTVKELQPDDTYTITGDIVVTYEADANNLKEDIQVQLAVDYPANADARDNFIVHARSLPAEFVIVAKSGDKWYALNADMSSSKAQPANKQIEVDDIENPTKATFAPCNTVYTFEAMPQGAADRISVRFIGMENKYLWAASGTNTGIQNNSTDPAADALAYNWKLYTTDNVTYQIGNGQNSRVLGLNSSLNFGMYAPVSGLVNDIRILPIDKLCTYNYAPTNLKVSVLKSTSVTLTWDAVAGATKYQYSTDGNTWTDAGTEPTVTINGLTGATKYIYYVRAYHEHDATKECIDYSEISFTTADCDDVPTDITYTADLNSITVSWTATAPTATIKLYMNEDGTGGGGTYPGATSPYKISGGLQKNTTYYIQIFSDGTCASPIVPVKTEDVKVDVVEWKTDGIIVDINTDETVGVTLENEVSYGSGLGSLAEDLFFSKYFEGSGSLKMIAIYNGTGKDVDLSEYRIDRGSDGDATNISKTYDLSQLGVIKRGQEIIFYSWPLKSEDSYSCSQSFLDSKAQESGLDANPRWILCDAKTHNGIEFEAMDFSGNDPLLLYKSSELIDVFGVSTEQESPASTQICSGRSDKAWSADGVTNMDYGKTTEDFPNGEIPYGVNVDDETITAYTARVIMFRKNTVVSGKNAVTKNTTTFATFADEWEARQVCRSGNDGNLTCAAYQELGTFDYSDYYTKYVSMGEGTTFDENDRNADGTVTIEITDLYKRACSNIRVKLTNSNSEVLSDREYKVPIMITTTQGTDGQAFLALQENLATVEVDDEGNPTGNKTNLTLEQVREICKTCDVVIRDNATLTKIADDAANDHPQVHDVYVYENSSLIVPNGTNYTINNLSLRRNQDAVASVSAYPDALKLPESAAAPITLDFRLSAESWHWFTLPFDCNISEVTWADGTPAQYNTDWYLMTYDGEKRAETQAGGCWKAYTGTTIRAGEGFILAINGNINNPAHTYELRFPMSKEVLAAEGTDKTVDVRAWGVETNIRPNHKGWNLVGNPYLAYYQRNNITNFEGLRLGQLTGPDLQTGYWEQTGDVPYVVVPVGAGWIAYEQVLASDIDLLPFTAYFVQVGKDGTHNSDQDLKVSFDHTKLQLSATPMPASIIQRSASVVEEPVIVGVSLTNAKGESDKTSLIIDDQYTDEYEMNADFFKWFGDYYKYYTKPVLYTIGADDGKRAFNAISEELATQPISLGMYAAQAGNYTFTLDRRSDLSKVQEVWLYDATQDTYTNLLQDGYTFNTAKTESAGRFFLSVKMAPKVTTAVDNITANGIWATTQDNQIVINGLTKDLQLWIYDATGKLLHADHTTNYQHSYSVPTSGVYFVRVNGQAEAQTIKVVVE